MELKTITYFNLNIQITTYFMKTFKINCVWFRIGLKNFKKNYFIERIALI